MPAPRVTHALSAQNPVFRAFLDDLAGAERLTILAGAGTSMDVGLPAWGLLLRNLLEAQFRSAYKGRKIGERLAYEALTARALSGIDLVSAATLATILAGDRRDEAIASALYEEHHRAPRPGRTALSIAGLASLFPGEARILTTNYDDLIEQAIRATSKFKAQTVLPLRAKAKTMKWLRKLGDEDRIPVVHLHGLAPYRGGSPKDLILDERDFVRAPSRLPGALFPTLLRDSLVLFVGMSMTDPNLVAACNAVRDSEFPRYIVFVDEIATDSSPSLEETEWRELTYHRLEDMGLLPIRLVSYGQIAQLLIEGSLRRRSRSYWDDSKQERYGARFSRWRAEIASKHPLQTDFEATERAIHDRLREEVDAITSGPLRQKRRPGEEFGIHLWARKPGARLGELELWASSTTVQRDRWMLEHQSVSVVHGTGIPAADAIYNGASSRRPSNEQAFSRWQTTIALPIELEATPWNNLPVGVISLSSTLDLDSSGLRHLNDEAVSALEDRLVAVGVDILTP